MNIFDLSRDDVVYTVRMLQPHRQGCSQASATRHSEQPRHRHVVAYREIRQRRTETLHRPFILPAFHPCRDNVFLARN